MQASSGPCTHLLPNPRLISGLKDKRPPRPPSLVAELLRDQIGRRTSPRSESLVSELPRIKTVSLVHSNGSA